MSFLEQLDELVESDSGEFRLIGKAKIEFGHKFFVSNADPSDYWYPFDLGNPESIKTSLAKATKDREDFIKLMDPSFNKKIQKCILILFSADTELCGYSAKWDVPAKHYFIPTWTPGFKEVVRKSLEEAGVPGPGDYWVSCRFVTDPSGRMITNREGEERPATIICFDKYFATQAEAEAEAKAVGGPRFREDSDSGSASAEGGILESPPKGFTAKSWAMMKDPFMADVKTDKSAKAISDEWDIPLEYVEAVKASL